MRYRIVKCERPNSNRFNNGPWYYIQIKKGWFGKWNNLKEVKDVDEAMYEINYDKERRNIKKTIINV